jgi:hypothetical protein
METAPLLEEGQSLVFISSTNTSCLFASTDFLPNFPNHALRHPLCSLAPPESTLLFNSISLPQPTAKWIASRR